MAAPLPNREDGPKPPAESVPNNTAKSKTRAPESTLEESKYLRSLVDRKQKVCIRMEDNENVCGFVEFFDTSFIRLTRPGEPNLFVYKHDIKYLYEESE